MLVAVMFIVVSQLASHCWGKVEPSTITTVVLQLFVKALCHWCPDDPSACPYVNSHLPGETLRQLEHLNFQTLFQYFHIFFICLATCFHIDMYCNVPHWSYSMNFELWTMNIPTPPALCLDAPVLRQKLLWLKVKSKIRARLSHPCTFDLK